MESIIRIAKEDEDIVIRCSIKDLVFLAETHPEYPMKILDIGQFSNEVVKELQNYSNLNNREKGLTNCEELFESILEEIGYSGSDSVEIIEIE